MVIMIVTILYVNWLQLPMICRRLSEGQEDMPSYI